MDIKTILTIVIGLIVLFIIIKFFTKVLAKIIAFVIVAGLILYILFYWNGGIINAGKEKFILYELQDKYCVEKLDTVKCECIIKPLINDIKANHTTEEILKLKDNRIKAFEILIESLNREKENIKQCLKENDSGFELDEFINDLKKFEIGKKIQKVKDAFESKTDES